MKMSLYNTLFRTNPVADVLLASLGITRIDVPRFRDCFFSDGQVVVHTRTGGGNRDYYESEASCRDEYPECFEQEDAPSGPWNEDLRRLPGYVNDEDDDYDSTYANFYFTPTPQLLQVLSEAEAADSPIPAERWRQLMDDLKRKSDVPEVKRAFEVGEKIVDQINKGTGDIIEV